MRALMCSTSNHYRKTIFSERFPTCSLRLTWGMSPPRIAYYHEAVENIRAFLDGSPIRRMSSI